MSKCCKTQQNIAIVLGPKCVNATGLIRSLGEAGFYVVFASTYSKIESKWAKSYVRLPKNEEAMLEVLYQYIRSLPSKPAVFTVDDYYNELLDEHHKHFEEVAFVPHANGRLKELCDKAVMSTIAKESGLETPSFLKVAVQKVECPLPLPVIVKPYAGYAGSKGDIRLCYTTEEWSDCMENLQAKGYAEVLVQELIEKQNQFEIGLLGIVLPNGEVEIPCTIKKIRSYPEGRGSTSYAQVKREFFGVDQQALKTFVRKTGYVGIFDIEMIVADGTAYFIEINYRNGQYGYAATKAGYNLPKNWFKGMLGEPIEQDVTIKEIFYMNEREDKLHVKDGKLSKQEWKKQFKTASAYGMYCPKDQRPYVRQYVKIPDRVSIKCRKIYHRIKDLLVKEEWNVAIRPRGERLLFENGNTAGFTVLKNSFRYWCADPFIIAKDGRDYLFFEMYDRFKAKGIIGYRVIENGKVGKMKIAHEMSTHLSFPNIFEYEGTVYMMPESCGAGKVSILKAVRFPDCWEEVAVLLERKVCDSVLYTEREKTYLLTQPLDTEKAVLEKYAIIDGSAQRCEDSPIVTGKRTSRMAGAIITSADKHIRVSQDCLMGYGLALNFHEMGSLLDEKYQERMVKRVEIKDMPNKQSKKYVGLHTYNLDERYETVDLKNKNRIRVGNVLNIFYRIWKGGLK